LYRGEEGHNINELCKGGPITHMQFWREWGRNHAQIKQMMMMRAGMATCHVMEMNKRAM
jgi:hypothetical protein